MATASAGGRFYHQFMSPYEQFRIDRRSKSGFIFQPHLSPSSSSSLFSSSPKSFKTRKKKSASSFLPLMPSSTTLRSSLYRLHASLSCTDGDTSSSSDSNSNSIRGNSEEESSTAPKASTKTDEATSSTTIVNEIDQDDEYFDLLFHTLTKNQTRKTSHNYNDHGGEYEEVELEEDDEKKGSGVGGQRFKLVDIIERRVGIQRVDRDDGGKKRRGRDKNNGRERGIATSAFSSVGKGDALRVKMDDCDDSVDGVDGKCGVVGEVLIGESLTSDVFESEEQEINESSLTSFEAKLDFHADSEATAKSVATISSSGLTLKSKLNSSATILGATINKTPTFPISTTVTVMEEQPPPSVNEKKGAPFNVVCTHITADFDTLASAIGLAKLWSLGIYDEDDRPNKERDQNSIVHGPLPTYVVLPRGAHPDVQRFLSLHKHLFPIRSLKSLPGFSDSDFKNNNNNASSNPKEGLQRVGLVDAQRRDRLGPAEILLPHAKLGVTIVDHHVDAESDIPETTHYIVDKVGSVSTMIAERLKRGRVELTEAEATILALGIHSDTGSLVYDSTVSKVLNVLLFIFG